MNDLNYLAATKSYYANWLSVSSDLLDKKGLFCFFSPERDNIQEGYSKPFDFYGFFSNQAVIITYGHKLEKETECIRDSYLRSSNLIEFKKAIKEKFGKNPQHDFKYYLAQIPSSIDIAGVKQLTEKDYPDFLTFFKTQYPDSQPETWLRDYFNGNVRKGYVFGQYVGEKLVSASDSPTMPYMKDIAIELGINTLPEYRNQGYGKSVLRAMLRFVTSLQKVPIVSCSSSNTASQELIQSAGFEKLADVVSLSL